MLQRAIAVMLRLYCRILPDRRLLLKRRLIETLNQWLRFSGTVLDETRFGARMVLDLSQYIQRQIYFSGAYEPYILEAFRVLYRLGRGGVMVDVGANVGQHSLFAAIALGVPRVYAFEPAPATFEALQKNVEINGLQEVIHCLPYGVADRADRYFLEEPRPGDHGSNYLTKQRSSGLPVTTVSLDEFTRDHGIETLALLKIDTEGAELKVLQGAGDLLARHRVDALVVELVDKTLSRFGASVQEVIRYLSDAGYVGYRFVRGRLQAIGPKDRLTGFNEAFFVPAESRERLSRALGVHE